MSSLLVDIDRLATYDAEGVAPYIIGKKETSSDPYTFRQGLGTMADMDIVGGTVAWNQLVQNGDFNSDSGWQCSGGTMSVSNNIATITTSGNTSRQLYTMISSIVDHVYFITGDFNPSINTTFYMRFGKYQTSPTKVCSANTWTTISGIKKIQNEDVSSNNLTIFNFYSLPADFPENESYQVRRGNAIDLTQMFGTTIADYIYSLEQTTEGAGVAWFRKLFPADYYPYDAGSLKSVEGLQSRDVIVFNQWDEEWEVGGIDSTTGEDTLDSSRIRSKNYIPVIEATYYFTAPAVITVLKYTVDKTFIGYAQVDLTKLLTFDETCKFIRFKCGSSSSKVQTYNHDICINISDPAKNGTYEPYRGYSYPLDSSLTLRGIPKLDSNNKLYYDGDIYRADGSVERKYGIVDLGTLTWKKASGKDNLFFSESIKKSTKMLSVKYLFVDDSRINSNDAADAYLSNNEITYRHETNLTTNDRIYVKDINYTDADTFKTAMSGVMLVYELATPTTETAKPYQNPQRAFSDGTEGFTMTGIVPVGNNSTYQLSKALIPAEDYTDGAMEILEDCIETKTDILAIAPNEPGTTSSQAYSAGDHFYKDGKFCTAITSISSGVTFTKNTNYREEDGGATSAMNNYRSKKLTATVSSTSLAFTDTLISNSATVIDGPYIADVMVGVTAATISNNTVTFTLDSSSANGKSAYIWLRY